jgi:hypothetical protein
MRGIALAILFLAIATAPDPVTIPAAWFRLFCILVVLLFVGLGL